MRIHRTFTISETENTITDQLDNTCGIKQDVTHRQQVRKAYARHSALRTPTAPALHELA